MCNIVIILLDRFERSVGVEKENIGVFTCHELTLAVADAHNASRSFGSHSDGVEERNAGFYASGDETVHSSD